MTPVLFPELAEPQVAPAPVPPTRRLHLSELTTRSALVRQKTTPGAAHSWFDWSATPYRGGEFGCTVTSVRGCYARAPHRTSRSGDARDTDPADFEREIYIKAGFVDALRRDLRRRVKPGEHIAFGTATDPYPPIEGRERVMFRALSALLDAPHGEGRELRISITTRSTLVARDAKLLALLAERHAVHVNFSITTSDARLARFLEPQAPTPEERLEALAELRRHGVEAGVFMTPLLPGITDAEQDVDALLRAASAAGARWLASHVVLLREPARAHFLRKLRRAYPRVAARYAWWTRYAPQARPGATPPGATSGSCGRLPENVRKESLDRVRRLAVRHGLSAAPDLDLPTPRRSRQATFAF